MTTGDPTTKMNFPIYIISLARAAERRANIRKRLELERVPYEIIEAVDGATLEPKSYAHRLQNDLCQKRYQERLTPNQIGCFLSHHNLWERMIAEQTPHALILEDDACWQHGFFEMVAALPNAQWIWEVVLLSHVKPTRVEKTLCELPHDFKLVRYRRPGWSTAAYMITLSGAKKLHKQCMDISGTVDTMMREYWRSGLVLYDVAPSPVHHPDVPSTIGYDRAPLTKAEHRQRQRMRNYRGFRRKLHHLLHPPKRTTTVE